ncbi:hypothetical protein K502DRAFT_330472 [Neoconidiobolus thromboides FSU 785]|nr:hypothetical protein K502DRAFT_330472 [Neoconidiobolus thromboides FSU 785]
MFDFYANCLVNLVSIVLLKLHRGHSLIKGHQVVVDASESAEMIKNIRLLASRILLYPIAMIVSNIGIVLNQAAYDLANTTSTEFKLFGNITASLLGTLNFIAFFCDPTIHQALKTVYLRTIKKQNDSDKIDSNVDAFALNEMKTSDSKDYVNDTNSEIEGQIPVQYSSYIKNL